MDEKMNQVIFFKNKADFIDWLESNHKTTDELWMGLFNKKANKAGLTWSESVDCALSFGWIDGLRKKIDEESYKIRFTPRRPDSVWSKVNVKKAHKLIELNQMRPEGLEIFNQRNDKTGYSSATRNIELTKEYEDEIKKKPHSWEFFSGLPASYKRDSIWWIMSAQKEETRQRRLNRMITSWEKGEMLRA